VDRNTIKKSALFATHLGDPPSALHIQRLTLGSNIMAKGQARSNRETKKPKQVKKLASPAAGVAWAAPKATAVASPAKKK
jgi:hypothetical protein